jgi:hypothetical protein
MKVNQKRSEELQQTILTSPDLLRELSEKVAGVLGDRVTLSEGATYVFVPRVYSRPTFWPEVYATASIIERIPFGGAGPLDPQVAKQLNEMRVAYQTVEDPSPEPANSRLRREILHNPELFLQLSETLAEVLTQHGVTFAKDETYAFIPVIVKKPVFSGQLAWGTPMPIPPSRPAMRVASDRVVAHFDYYEFNFEFEYELDPGTIIDGIPAPEILQALEQQRIVYT